MTNQINEQLNGFMLGISNQLTNFTNTITKKMDEMIEDLVIKIGKEIAKNNVRLSFFFLYMINSIVPNFHKPEEKIVHHICNRFNNHQLGNLSSKTFTEYINKL